MRSCYLVWLLLSRDVESHVGVEEAEQPFYQDVILLLQQVEQTLLQTLVREHGQHLFDPNIQNFVHSRHGSLDDDHVRAAATDALSRRGTGVALST